MAHKYTSRCLRLLAHPLHVPALVSQQIRSYLEAIDSGSFVSHSTHIGRLY